MWACGLSLSWCSLIQPVCLSSSVSHKQWLVSLRAASSFPQCSFATTSEPLKILQLSWQVEIVSYSHKSWERQCFEKMNDNYLKSINKASLLTSHIYQKMLRQMSLVCILHVAAGCHQDHRQSDIIIRSVYCHLRKSLALFWYCWC